VAIFAPQTEQKKGQGATDPRKRVRRRRRGPYDSRMCIICIDFDRGALNPNEARRALSEMRDSLPADHVRQLEQKIEDADEEEPTSPHQP